MACKDNNSRWGEDARCSEGAAHLPQRAGGGGRQQGIPGARDEPDAGELGECYNPRPVPPISVVLDGERAGRETVFGQEERTSCAQAVLWRQTELRPMLEQVCKELGARRRQDEGVPRSMGSSPHSSWHPYGITVLRDAAASAAAGQRGQRATGQWHTPACAPSTRS